MNIATIVVINFTFFPIRFYKIILNTDPTCQVNRFLHEQIIIILLVEVKFILPYN